VLAFSTGTAATLNELGKEILEETWQFHPVSATYLGVHDYDRLLADYSQNSLSENLNRFKRLKQKLDELDTLSFSVDELIDYHLLGIMLDQEIFAMERAKSYTRNPLTYVRECIDGVYAILVRSAPSEAARAEAMRERLTQVPAFLEDAKRNLENPPEILCEIGVDQLDEGVSLIEDAYSAHEECVSEVEKEDFQRAAASAVAAMRVFAYWLRQNGDPDAPYTLVKEDYEYQLKEIHLLDIDADSLLKIGHNVLQSAVEALDSLENLPSESPPRETTPPPNFGKEDIFEYRQGEIEFMRDYLAQSDIVTIPEWVGDLRVVETPGFLRTIIPGIAMLPPGPFDHSDTSYFFVRPLPDKLDAVEAHRYYSRVQNRSFKRSVVHEGYPGHHLQLSIANHHPSPVRKSFFDPFPVEGWALYCEEMMARTDLYEDTLQAIINALYGVRFRAARVVVDVMLQTGQFSYDDAVDFMATKLRGNRAYYAREVKRYITNPAQPSSYLVGKLQILDLLDDYRRAKGKEFDLKHFHDTFLSYGSVPIALIRRAMETDLHF
jgi:uncharacterized protein (DUF885 family)